MNVISGGPDWIKSDFWDVVALIPEGALTSADLPRAGHWRHAEPSKLQRMVERLLIERVGLVVRREIKEVPAYLLKMTGTAPRFTPPWERASPAGRSLNEQQVENLKQFWENSPSGQLRGEPGGNSGKDISMKDLAELLAGLVGRPVADETGFSRPFNLSMAFRHPRARRSRPTRGSRVFPTSSRLSRNKSGSGLRRQKRRRNSG